MALSPNTKRFLIIAGVITLVLAIASPFAWQALKDFRANSLMEKAEQLREDEQYREAWEAARAAYVLNPDDPEIARTLAGLEEMAEPASAPELWEEIYAMTGDESDLLAWFDSVFRLGDPSPLAPIAKRLAADFPNSAEATVRRARTLLANGELEPAIALFSEAARKPYASGEIQFSYVTITQRSEDPAVRQAGIEWLREMTKADTELAVKALRNLLQAPGLTNEERLAVAERLAQHPKAERRDQLTEIVVRRNIGQEPIAVLLEDAKSLFEQNNPEDMVELGRWLNQQGRSGDFIGLVDIDAALKRRDLFLVWIDAMAVEGRWADLENVVERTSLPIDPFTQRLFRARIQDELGNNIVGNLTWSQAVIAAQEDVGKLTFAYDYATKLGWQDKAREVLERLSRMPETQRKAFEQMIELDQRQGDVTSMRDVLARMHERYPNDANVANDLAYVNLLLGQNVESSGETAVRLLQASEKPFLANVMTLALAQYRLGRSDLALEQLYTLPINWDDVRPGWRAIYAAILEANGHSRESQTIMAGVNPEDLLPPERLILRDSRQ